MIYKKTILLAAFLMFCIISNLSLADTAGLTADQIINRRDDNEFYSSARLEGEMIVINGNRQMKKSFTSLSDKNNSLTEFTNPMDRGTRFLKRDDELYMFFPDAEDVVHISGHMLNNSMMGSDYSYKDMMESEKLTDLYDFKIIGEEKYKDRPCYLIEGTKVDGKEDVQYYRRKIWVDKERFIGLKEELYAQSGRLLKVSEVTEVKKINERWFPMKSVMVNKLRKNTSTEFIVDKIEFNPEIANGTFTLENLQS